MITKAPRNTLAVEKPETILQKHPSAKALCDENGEILVPSDTIKNEILTFNIDSNNKEDSSFSNNDDNSLNIENKESNDINKEEDEKEMKITNNKKTFFIQINTCEHKKINEKESFFIEASPPNTINNNNVINNNKLLVCNFNNNIYSNNNLSYKDNNKNSNGNKKLLGLNFINNNNINSSNEDLNLSKPLFYGFDQGQNNFDKEITQDISQGKDYKVIENKFLNVLKKQK